MVRKDNFTLGLEAVLNNEKTSFLKNPKTFYEIHKASGMSMSQMFEHIGKASKSAKEKKVSEDEKIKNRLSELASKN